MDRAGIHFSETRLQAQKRHSVFIISTLVGPIFEKIVYRCQSSFLTSDVGIGFFTMGTALSKVNLQSQFSLY